MYFSNLSCPCESTLYSAKLVCELFTYPQIAGSYFLGVIFSWYAFRTATFVPQKAYTNAFFLVASFHSYGPRLQTILTRIGRRDSSTRPQLYMNMASYGCLLKDNLKYRACCTICTAERLKRRWSNMQWLEALIDPYYSPNRNQWCNSSWLECFAYQGLMLCNLPKIKTPSLSFLDVT